jgi:hypothetical protein
MRFKRITENQSYEQIVQATEELRKNGFYDKEVKNHQEIIKLNLNFDRCTTTGVGICGQGEYLGTVVTDGENGYKVIDIYIDTLCPKETNVCNITENLGMLNPAHPKCDIRKPISMAIIYYLEQFGELPNHVKRHIKPNTTSDIFGTAKLSHYSVE